MGLKYGSASNVPNDLTGDEELSEYALKKKQIVVEKPTWIKDSDDFGIKAARRYIQSKLRTIKPELDRYHERENRQGVMGVDKEIEIKFDKDVICPFCQAFTTQVYNELNQHIQEHEEVKEWKRRIELAQKTYEQLQAHEKILTKKLDSIKSELQTTRDRMANFDLNEIEEYFSIYLDRPVIIIALVSIHITTFYLFSSSCSSKASSTASCLAALMSVFMDRLQAYITRFQGSLSKSILPSFASCSSSRLTLKAMSIKSAHFVLFLLLFKLPRLPFLLQG